MTTQTIWHYFQRNRSMFQFWPMWNSQGHWRPSWKCHNIWHIRKMLVILLVNSVQSLKVLRVCAQWMCLLAALLYPLKKSKTKLHTNLKYTSCANFSLWCTASQKSLAQKVLRFEHDHASMTALAFYLFIYLFIYWFRALQHRKFLAHVRVSSKRFSVIDG